MKRLSLYLLLVCFAVFSTQTSSAQNKKEKDKKHEVHVKVIVIEDGKETIIDTVFYEATGHDRIIEMMELKGMSDSVMKKHHIFFSKDGDHHGKHNKIVKTIHVSSNGEEYSHSDAEMRIFKKFKFSDKDGNVFFHSGDSCLKKDIQIDMLHGGGHKMHIIESHGKKGEKVIILNNSEDIEITEEDGYKIIKIKTSGDDKVWIEKDIDITVEVDDKDGKKVKKIKRKKKKE